jgi:CubicO group peptidase (beta-lactamase class C family)
MSETRRYVCLKTLAVLGAVLSPGIAYAKSYRTKVALSKTQIALIAMVDSGQIPAVGLIVRRHGKTIVSRSAGFADIEKKRAFQVTTPFRVASISKLVTALCVHKLASAGGLDLDADISPHLSFALRNPRWPEKPISLNHLLTHLSTIKDVEPYWMDAPGRLSELIRPELFETGQGEGPGSWFSYANLNYSLIATVLENITRERFDLLAHRLLFAPLGLDVGYNWSGVSAQRRRQAASLYRLYDGQWRVEVDGDDMRNASGPSLRRRPDFKLEDYVLGSNGSLFGAHGGLRASLTDLIALLHEVRRYPAMQTPLWQVSTDILGMVNGNDDKGFFHAYGPGPMIVDARLSPLGQKMVGHHGQAYGLFAQIWYLPDLDIDIAFALTGTPQGDPSMSKAYPFLNLWEEKIMDIVKESLS